MAKKTDMHCTRCGREFEPFEDVVNVATGFIRPYTVLTTDAPLLAVLCPNCYTELFAPKPNRVVVEMSSGLVRGIRAVRPDDVIVLIQTPGVTNAAGGPHTVSFGRGQLHPIGKLNAVKEEA